MSKGTLFIKKATKIAADRSTVRRFQGNRERDFVRVAAALTSVRHAGCCASYDVGNRLDGFSYGCRCSDVDIAYFSRSHFYPQRFR